MIEQLITKISSLDVIGTISGKIKVLSEVVDQYLSNMEDLKLVSILLMVLAALMFLFVLIVMYVRSFINFLKAPVKKKSYIVDESDDIFDEEDERRLLQIIEDQDRERELEKELQKELEIAQAEREKAERQEEQNLKIKEEALQQKKQEEKEKEQKKKKEPAIKLDWKKGTLLNSTGKDNSDALSPSIMSYHQSNKQMNELLGLIIDMIGRGVDDLKIAQTILYRNHYMSSEEDVFQIIDSIKNFIDICKNQEFSKLDNYDSLPNEEDALIHMAEGDTTPALALLENLMDLHIDYVSKPGMENRRDETFRMVSEQAVTFGNLAAINDVHLATGAFELAIELNPQNIPAWSRLADMYAKAESNSKAIWAYQNILDMADGEINAREVANASKNMSQYLYAQGNSLQAAKLYNSSKQYYDAMGVNRRLDKQEIEIIEIIESNHKDEIRSTIHKLLGRDAGMDFSF